MFVFFPVDDCCRDFSTLSKIEGNFEDLEMDVTSKSEACLRLLPVPSELDFDSDVSSGKSNVYKIKIMNN